MKRRLWLLLGLLLIPSGYALAAVTYTADITVTNNSTTDYGEIGVLASENVSLLVANGYILSTGLDVRILRSGAELPFTIATDKVTFATTVNANSSNNYQFTTGNTASSAFQIVPGYGGYVTSNDTATSEMSNNATLTINGVYVDTSVAGNITGKLDAINLYSTGSGNVTVTTANSTTLTEQLAPDGAGTATALILVGAATNWQANLTNDGDTSYVVQIAAGNNYDLYSITNTGVGAGTIEKVSVTNVAKNTAGGAGNGHVATELRTYATNYAGTITELTNAYTAYTTDYATNPNTGNAWTWTEVDALEAGTYLDCDGGGSQSRTTQTYVTVYYHVLDGQTLSTVLAAGKHDFKVVINTDPDFQLYVDSVLSANLTGTTVSVPDNANPYVFFSNAVPYIGSINMTVAGANTLWYEPNDIIIGTVLPDRAGNMNGDITWGSNPTGVTATFGGLTSTQVITTNTTSSGYIGNFMPSDVGQLNSPTLNQAELAVESDWWYPFIKPFADTSGTQAVWFYWAGTILWAVVFFILAYRTRHLLLAAIAFDIPFGYGITKAFIPEWAIIILALWTVGAVIQEVRMG